METQYQTLFLGYIGIWSDTLPVTAVTPPATSSKRLVDNWWLWSEEESEKEVAQNLEKYPRSKHGYGDFFMPNNIWEKLPMKVEVKSVGNQCHTPPRWEGLYRQ